MTLEIQSTGVAVERRWLTRTVLWGFFAGAAAVSIVAGNRFFGLGDETTLVPFLVGCFVWVLASASLLKTSVNPTPSASFASRAPAHVVVDDAFIGVRFIDGRQVRLPCSALVEGWTESLPLGTSAVLSFADRTVVSLTTHDTGESTTLLRALGLAADQQVLKMRLQAASQRGLWRGALALLQAIVLPVAFAFGVFMLSLGESSPAVWVGLAVILALFFRLIATVTPPVAVVGGDGILIQRLGSKDYIPYSSVRAARALEQGVALTDPEGKVTILPSQVALRNEHASPPSIVLAERIQTAMMNAARGASARAAAGALARNGRPWNAYREHLRSLLSAIGGYRTTTLQKEDLLAVFEDNAAPPDRRVAALLALASAPDAELYERLRVVVETCADEDMRAAMEDAAYSELEEQRFLRIERASSGASRP